jgi:hypothetical protein
MARLVRPGLFGLLWLALGATAFATPLRTDSVAVLDPNKGARFDVLSLSDIDDPKQALEDLCRDPGYFLVLPDPSDSDSDAVPDFGEVFSPVEAVDLTGAIRMGPNRRSCYHEACETSSL